MISAWLRIQTALIKLRIDLCMLQSTNLVAGGKGKGKGKDHESIIGGTFKEDSSVPFPFPFHFSLALFLGPAPAPSWPGG